MRLLFALFLSFTSSNLWADYYNIIFANPSCYYSLDNFYPSKNGFTKIMDMHGYLYGTVEVISVTPSYINGQESENMFDVTLSLGGRVFIAKRFFPQNSTLVQFTSSEGAFGEFSLCLGHRIGTEMRTADDIMVKLRDFFGDLHNAHATSIISPSNHPLLRVNGFTAAKDMHLCACPENEMLQFPFETVFYVLTYAPMTRTFLLYRRQDYLEGSWVYRFAQAEVTEDGAQTVELEGFNGGKKLALNLGEDFELDEPIPQILFQVERVIED